MSGICIYAEQYENRIEESAFELITAARHGIPGDCPY